MRRRFALIVIALLAAVTTAFAGAIPATAATTGSWSSWTDLVGTANAFTGSVTLAGKPALTATLATDSRAGSVGVISGSTTWLSEGTPVGAKYGSSKNKPYLNLRPKADTAVAPSTTTYTFQTPAPPSGWTFVLGDIDADKVQVRATGPDGVPLTVAQLGYRSSFNYCAPGVVGKPSCTGDAADVPSWDPATQTLTGNPAAADTNGASAWFEPSAPVSTLTFVYTRRSGFPVYQTWFASLARDIAGTVTNESDGQPTVPVDGAQLRLIDRNGTIVGTTASGADGTYSFTGYIATDGYRVEVVAPIGTIAVGGTGKPVDLTDADGTADFVVRDIVPVPVSGTVTAAGGGPLAGVTVTIPGLDGAPPQVTMTDSSGNYFFDTVDVGDRTVVVTPPPGYSTSTPSLSFTIPAGSTTPITGEDFELVPNPSLSGTVTAGGTGLGGVTVTAHGPDGDLSTLTASDGSYTFPLLDAGDYSVTVTTPDGFELVGPGTLDRTVAESDVTGVDFTLDAVLLGSLGGGVVAGTDPVPDATVVIDGPGGPTTLTTGPDGGYAIGSLPEGTYTATLTVPDGYTAGGPLTQQITIDGSGAAVTVPDFVLVAVVAPTPSPSPTVTPTDAATVGSHTGQLSSTGVQTGLLVAGGVAVVVVIAGAVILIVRRVRESRRNR
ncbi:MSCRAMM family protein [Plantibacter sp. Mn2098]|uniref:MSCRAMM family protein n=1 Tax=Plantibacter sp. Mn2098 TaxID=3395266 RepID=UPI003BE5C5A1